MGDIQTRPFSKNYSGLVNQSVIGLAIVVLCTTGKKTYRDGELGSRESWEFGYLYQGRCWARYASPRIPLQWPLGWLPQTLRFSEEQLNQLRGVDAALYIRFLRGCFWFILLQTCTTFPILLPIHLEFSEGSISPKSMTRASISSLVSTSKGLSLLWIHICLLFWITLSWIATLLWIIHGAFRMRSDNIAAAAQRKASNDPESRKYHPHPHPPYNFADDPSLDTIAPVDGLRFRTIMVSNIPPQLRNEKELQEYFEYYMSRKLEKPSLGLNSTTQPGMFNKMFSFLFNRVKKIPGHQQDENQTPSDPVNPEDKPRIERVVIARKMTELASLLERREEILRLLETAHIKLAKTTLNAVKKALEEQAAHKPFSRTNSRAGLIRKQKPGVDLEIGDASQETTLTDEQLLGPYVGEFGLKPSLAHGSLDSDSESIEGPISPTSPKYPPSASTDRPLRLKKTIWEAMLCLPRSTLDPYQPLVRLSHLFRGKAVPSIDYYTAKLNLLTSLITENRAKPANKYDPVSTAFVTFADPEDARKACKYLTVHPNNPLTCLVTMAPQYQDLDWHRVMKSPFNAELVKDWVVSVGVWPLRFSVGLVSIQNISTFWPKLKTYLDSHPWEEEVIQSFLPTLLVSLLALLIPLILLLIGKKAHTITTLSALHDRIMTRYYKFLVVNVLVFFFHPGLVGASSAGDVLTTVASSFPTAGHSTLVVIFTTAMHGGFEIAMFGLPLIMYPSTTRQVTPRRRAVGIRPRTFNYYYWLPTHLLVIHVLLVFSVLNPLVIPFVILGASHEFANVVSGVVKNHLIHVYAKNYEGNGQVILIRAIRYSLDGLVLAQTVFLAYMVVLKKSVNVGLSAFLMVFTIVVKICTITRICRAQFENDDVREAKLMCNVTYLSDDVPVEGERPVGLTEAMNAIEHQENLVHDPGLAPSRNIAHRAPIPFSESRPTFSRLMSMPNTAVALLGTLTMLLPPRLPYDNPFYTRAISNVLWLPRDPCGTLDLDDTVNLKVAISVDPAAGQLGTWMGVSGETKAPTDNTPHPFSADGAASILSEALSSTSEPEVDGTENINLPEILAKRAESKDDIELVARSRRPSTFRRATSKSSFASLGSQQRPSSSRYAPRSRSASDAPARPKAPTQNSIMSTNISANRAIYHEILAEEKHALEQRLEEEQAEVDKQSKSWFTKWMFKKTE
ncbi:hypothetical protein BDP27DRAFT_1311677 [Rhodocollybia butyracea]|uniref:CSC1/OSCA1-like 7TM region domain-containing protein n=1 Tax=Rhodocollybia butyracea TaxID=206335 RepID=A0A9P5Q9F9_9AGAR|nr:hypothetical protein BDP27DRAFT_1311677 [Rhodocollybia butyracea]